MSRPTNLLPSELYQVLRGICHDFACEQRVLHGVESAGSVALCPPLPDILFEEGGFISTSRVAPWFNLLFHPDKRSENHVGLIVT